MAEGDPTQLGLNSPLAESIRAKAIQLKPGESVTLGTFGMLGLDTMGGLLDDFEDRPELHQFQFRVSQDGRSVTISIEGE